MKKHPYQESLDRRDKLRRTLAKCASILVSAAASTRPEDIDFASLDDLLDAAEKEADAVDDSPRAFASREDRARFFSRKQVDA